MSANLLGESNYQATFGDATAIYFASGDRTLFGWLHRPVAATTGGIGLVICKAFGYEAICSHRSMRVFAESAAASGFPALRFDYSGTGDSEDIDPEANQLDAWAQDVVAAIQELRRCAGVERVCLVGFRLGALLAMLAADRSNSVHSVILIAPVISGCKYLRELRTTRLFAASGPLGIQSTDSAKSPRSGVEEDANASIEISGFPMSSATVAALRQTDLNSMASLPVEEMLVIDTITLPTARGWVDKLLSGGLPVTYLTMSGMVEMLMTDPQFAIVPDAAVTAVSDWLRHQSKSAVASGSQGSVQANVGDKSVPLSPTLQLPVEGSSQAPLIERPIFLASDIVLFGIVTEPSRGDKRRRAVILLNVGAESHIGPSRIYVALARRWARHGYTVLRLDLGGLGDSATRSGRPEDEVFPPAALEEIWAAINFIKAKYGIVDITLGGLCSGAYHALHAASAAMPVNRILLVNPMNYFWKPGMTADTLQQTVDVTRNVGFYRDRIFSAAIWKRILTGQLDIWRILRIFFQRPIVAAESAFRDLARRLRIHLAHDLGWELEAIGARGIKIVFVFARGEPGIDLLRLQAGSSVRRLGDHCQVHIVDSADHIFSHSDTRTILEKTLSDELFAKNPASGTIPP